MLIVELVDCDTLDQGCGGGLPENAYKAIQKLGGLETEQAYPYDGKNEKCHYKSDLAKAQVTGFVEVSKNETEMAAWLVKNGPISIGLNANAMQVKSFKIILSKENIVSAPSLSVLKSIFTVSIVLLRRSKSPMEVLVQPQAARSRCPHRWLWRSQ